MSRATVSRVVNGSPKVSPKIVASVTKAINAIKAINYVPNRAARSLTGRQTQALALVVPEDKTLRYLRSGNVEGALIISHHTGDDFVAELETTMPLVFGGRPSNTTTWTPSSSTSTTLRAPRPEPSA